MRIIQIESRPVIEFPYLNAGRAGKCDEARLPVQIGTVDRLPDGVTALVVTSDLQGREHFQFQTGSHLRLLGEWLPEMLRSSVLPSLSLSAKSVGVLLAGDFYTVPKLDKRGGIGDVTPVWEAFAREFSWVVGVAGNHDSFGNDPFRVPSFQAPVHFLDGDTRDIGRLTIAGISGIFGNPKRPWRKDPESFVCFLESLHGRQPDILLMHDGPDVPERNLRGTSLIRETLEKFDRPLVIRGHKHWDMPVAELSGGLQVLNVDARVVILVQEGG